MYLNVFQTDFMSFKMLFCAKTFIPIFLADRIFEMCPKIFKTSLKYLKNAYWAKVLYPIFSADRIFEMYPKIFKNIYKNALRNNIELKFYFLSSQLTECSSQEVEAGRAPFLHQDRWGVIKHNYIEKCNYNKKNTITIKKTKSQ